MFVFVQGTHQGHNNAEKIAAIAATLSAAKYNRKTLLIQATNIHIPKAENVLIGKKLEDTRIRLETFRIEDKGIDALMRRSQTNKLVKDHFDAIAEPLLKHENMLDSIGHTQKEDFEMNLTLKNMRTILHQSTSVYDNVFVLIDGNNKGIMAELLELADVCITCLAQLPVKESYNTFPKKEETEIKEKKKSMKEQRMLKVITNYDPFSVYNVSYIRKNYGDRKIYTQPINTYYNDACLGQVLLEFLLKNINDSPEDYNYPFISEILKFMEGVMDKRESEEERTPEIKVLNPPQRTQEVPELSVVTENDFEEIEITEKRGLFGKGYKKKQIVTKEMATFEKELEVNKDVADGYEEDMENVDTDVLSDNKTKENQPQRLTRRERALQHKNEKSKMKEEKRVAKETKKKGKYTETTISKENQEEKWVCQECNTENIGKFCTECGGKRPEKPNVEYWTCSKCGNETNVGKFCDECGARKPWICPQCQTENTGKFCMECGEKI